MKQEKGKILILTQQLIANYGGVLQAFALQKILRDRGWDVWTDNRRHYVAANRKGKYVILLRQYFLGPLKRCLCKLLGIKCKALAWAPDRRSVSYFTKKYLNIIDLFKGFNYVPLKLIQHFDIFIVGSDQVWRPQYSPYLPNYFFDFLENTHIPRIAYAASFGVSSWPLSEEETQRYSLLAKQFLAISVREQSGVTLCENYLGVQAQHVLDPTLILTKEDYIGVIDQENEPRSKGDLITYMLDEHEGMAQKLNALVAETQLTIAPLMEEKEGNFVSKISVAGWLRGFYDAKVIVTDSFHGSVFSILFNKPFLVIVNRARGEDRFLSLLKLFHLEDRLVYSLDDINMEKMNEPVDWETVNNILSTERAKSIAFLEDSLEKALQKS